MNHFEKIYSLLPTIPTGVGGFFSSFLAIKHDKYHASYFKNMLIWSEGNTKGVGISKIKY